MKGVLAVPAAVAGAILAGWYVHTAAERMKRLESRVNQVERDAARLGEEARRSAVELAGARQAASEAEDRAASAERLASESEASLRRAEAEARAAESGAAESRARLAQTADELRAIRERRQRELDRMREALGRIAPTRRTASGMVIELTNESFHFDFDKAVLRPENRELLSRIAGVLLASSGYRMFIYGHTDDIGDEAYNQQLSERRAEAVRSYLRRAGVPPEVMEMRGFGQSSPRDPARTSEARQKNRRVEIGVVDTVVKYEGTTGGEERAPASLVRP